MIIPASIPRDYAPNRATPDPDREFCSYECRQAVHTMCDGHYDTNGSAIGYDTYRCHCACHEPVGGPHA